MSEYKIIKEKYEVIIQRLILKYQRCPLKITHAHNAVLTHSLNAGSTGTIITFTVPAGNRCVSYSGYDNAVFDLHEIDLHKIPELSEIDSMKAKLYNMMNKVHGFGIMASDSWNVEVSGFTGVEIQYFDPVYKQFTSVDSIYREVSLNVHKIIDGHHIEEPRTQFDYFRFDQGVILKAGHQQKWKLISPDINVDCKHVRYVGEWDTWV